MRAFSPWIFGEAIVVYMDNASAISVANPDHLINIFKRRLEHVVAFCPRIKFLPRKMNILPDCLCKDWGGGRLKGSQI